MGLKRLLATPRHLAGYCRAHKGRRSVGLGRVGGPGGPGQERRRLPAHPGCRSRSRPGPPLRSRDLGYRFLGGDG